MMNSMVGRLAILILLILVFTDETTEQQIGGKNVCIVTRRSFLKLKNYWKTCGWEWGWKKCSAIRYILKYKSTNDPVCCKGWTSHKPGDVDCDIAICYEREGKHRGTCENGGKCVSPDKCECLPGFKLPYCEDIDECYETKHGCSHVCVNTNGSYHCECPNKHGLLPDGRTCIPTCYDLEPPGKCLHDHKCRNPDYCECGPGYSEPKCEDKDECIKNVCDQKCLNFPGSYKCACRDGYLLNKDGVTCEPQCSHVPDQICPNGGHCVQPDICKCPPGFQPPDCSDIDECAADNNCAQTCKNEPGSFKCGCNSGFILQSDGHFCKDIEECKIENGGCSHICVEMPGSMLCKCPKNWELLSDSKTCGARCFQEFQLELGVCPNGGICKSPNYCECADGFERPTCTDIDECSVSNGGCSHTCTNTNGTFNCSCPTGYNLKDGTTCTDVNECELANKCDGLCINELGTYRCQCTPGMTLAANGFECEDIDECETGSSGCQQECVNKYGSFACHCSEGFLLAEDGKNCFKNMFCDDKEEPGCWPKCKPNAEGKCICPEGMKIHSDQIHCIDPCLRQPCQHGGACQIDTELGFKCNCSQTDYTGDRCQHGFLQVPPVFYANLDVTYSNLTLKIVSDQDTVIRASSDAKVKIFPNPVTMWKSENSLKLNIRAEEGGILSVTFNVTNSQIPQKIYTMKVISADVFVRHQLLHQTLPEGCFYLNITDKDRRTSFRSTRPWFSLKTDSKTYFTFGIAYFIVPKTALPMSINGLQVFHGKSIRTGKLPSSRKESHGVRHVDSRDESCEPLYLSSRDLQQFYEARSLLRTLFGAIKARIPYWLVGTIVPPEDPKASPHYYRSRILTGKMLRTEKYCQVTAIYDDHLYTVFSATDAFTLSFAGQIFPFPEADQQTPYCFITDFIDSGAFFAVMNTDASEIVDHLPFADLLNEHGLKVRPQAFGLSDAWDMKSQYKDDLIFFNGATMFEFPPLGDITLLATLAGSKTLSTERELDLAIETTGTILTDIQPDNVFSHLHTKATNFFLVFDTLTVHFRCTIMGKPMEISLQNILHTDQAIIGNGGDNERPSCGMAANPPGLFARARLRASVSKFTEFIINPLISLSADVHYFMTFDDKDDTHVGWNSERVASLIRELLRNINRFEKLIKQPTQGIVGSWRTQVISEMKEILSGLDTVSSEFDVNNITLNSFADLSHSLLTKSAVLTEKLDYFEDKLKLDMEENMSKSMRSLKRANKLIEGQVKGLWWEGFDGSVPFFPVQKVWGFKTTIDFSVLAHSFIADVEFVMSPERLMQCSELYEYYDHVQGGRVLRASGMLMASRNYLKDIKKTPGLAIFWALFPPLKGGGLELAFSLTKPVFVIRLRVKWVIFKINFEGNMFITNDEVVALAEATILEMFRVRLTLGFAVPRKATDLSMWLHGDFLPGEEYSFDWSLWEAVKRVIRTKHKHAQKRLDEMQHNIVVLRRKITEAKDYILQSLGDRDSKQEAFDAAVKRFEDAKIQLERAKKPIKDAIDKLDAIQRKADKMCKAKVCEKKCKVTISAEKCKHSKKKSCMKKRPCGTKMSQPKCVLKKVVCEMVRILAVGSLAVVKGVTSVPLLALEAAKVAVSVTQTVVDKSRYLLDLSKALYAAALIALDVLELTFDSLQTALTFLSKTLKSTLNLFNSLIIDTLQKFIDFKRCGFKVEISVKNWFLVSGHCEVNLMSTGWVKHSFTINFKDISSSLFGFAKSQVDKGSKMENQPRRKRSVDTGVFESLASNRSDGFAFEYQSWSLRCEHFASIAGYLNTSVQVLRNLSMEVTAEVEEVEQEINEDAYGNEEFDNLTQIDTSINLQAAYEEFNLTRLDIEMALQKTPPAEHELVLATRDFEETVLHTNQDSVQVVRDSTVINDWHDHMNAVNFIGDCENFSDCVHWSIGELDLLLESLDPNLVKLFRSDLLVLLRQFEDHMQNESKTINLTVNVDIDLTVLENLNSIFCGTLPEFKEHPGKITIELGQDAEFRCRAESYPPPTYYWFREDKLIAFGKSWTKLTLLNASLADEGAYTCVAGHHMGNVSSEKGYLYVAYAPSILVNLPREFQFSPTSQNHPVASFKGSPNPNLVWYVCSSRVCWTRYSETLPHLKDFRGTRLVYKYKAYNDYGGVESNEMLFVEYDIQPAAPSKQIQFGYIVSLLHDTDFDSFDMNQTLNNDSLSGFFLEKLSESYIGQESFMRIEVQSVDTTNQTVTLLLQPVSGWLANDSATRAAVDNMLAEMNVTLKALDRDVQRGSTIGSDSLFRYSFNPADELEEEETRFLCNTTEVFQHPHFCVQTPPGFELESPKDVRVSSSGDNVTLKWEPPFYDQFLLKQYSIRIIPENGPDLYKNTSCDHSTFTLPISVCGNACEVQVSALTSSLRSKWAVLKVHPHNVNQQSDNDGIELSVCLGIPFAVVCVVLLVSSAIALWSYLHKRHKLRAVQCSSVTDMVKKSPSSSPQSQTPVEVIKSTIGTHAKEAENDATVSIIKTPNTSGLSADDSFRPWYM